MIDLCLHKSVASKSLKGKAQAMLLAFCAATPFALSAQGQIPMLGQKATAAAQAQNPSQTPANVAPARSAEAPVRLSKPAQTEAEDAAMHLQPTLKTHPMGDYGTANGDFNSETPSNTVTHMISGHSIFIDTKHRLAKVYVTNPEVLDSYTSSPNQVVLTAKKPGMSTLVLWDETGEAKTYQVSSDLNAEMLSDSIKKLMPDADIHVQSNENRVILTGTVGSVAHGEQVAKMAAIYTKDVMNSMVVNSSTTKQVKLEVRIVEVDRSKMSSFAFNFFSAGGNNLASTTTNQYGSTLSVTQGGTTGGKQVTLGNPLNFSLYSSRLNIGATLQDLATMQVLQILAEPTIVAISGEKGSFLAGGEFPFPVVQSSTTGTAISIQFRSYGVKLDFTPFVNPDGTVELKVAPEVSALDYANAVNIAGYTIPAISTRRAETDVVVANGQTFAISGLLDRRTTDLYSKTPGIASVPILGQLFKSKGVTHADSELIVIVTPTIVDIHSSNIRPEATPVIPFLDRKDFDNTVPGKGKQ